MTRRSILTTFTAAVAAIALAQAPAASAITFPVTKTADTNDSDCAPTDCSLREALDEANSAGTADDLAVPPGTYQLTLGQLSITDTVTIDGDDDSLPHIVAASGSRVIQVATPGGESTFLQDLVIRGGNVTGASGGGISNAAGGPLQLERVRVTGNSAIAPAGTNQGGGGIYHAAGSALNVLDSTIDGNTATISGNNSGGGGIYAEGGAVVQNSTIDGNRLNGTGSNSGGGGFFSDSGSDDFNQVTLSVNSSALGGDSLYNDGAVLSDIGLANSILDTGGTNLHCAGNGGFSSGGGNVEFGNTCGLGAGDLPSTHAELGALQDNGGPTPTRALAPTSPAINFVDQFGTCLTGGDQRGFTRPVGNDCDSGAYELEGATTAAIPNCSRSGEIPLTADPVAGSGVLDIRYQVDGGPTQIIDVPDGPDTQTRTLTFPEGRRNLTVWAQYSEGEALARPSGEVLVDQTNPTVGIENNQRLNIFVIKRRVSVDVNAGDALSGLVQDPSGAAQPLNTGARGTQTAVKTATDLCENQATAAFDYTVLAPKLGVRTVVEPLNQKVKIRPRSGGARAAQKGGGLVKLAVPRELPVGAFVDTRRGGRARLTTSSNAGDGIQDGTFFGGLFQALQSRSKKRSVRGLTTLTLKGSSFRRCTAAGRGKRASASQRRRLGSGTIRKLQGNAKGRFRTRGRHSSATVRGTIWTVSDRCDGTLTKVKRGRVAVRDFRRKRTIVLRAGKRYLARRPF